MTRTQPIYTRAAEESRSKDERTTRNATEANTTHVRIDTDLLIPGRGQPIKTATLIYTPPDIPSSLAASTKPGKITYAGPTSSLPIHLSSLHPTSHVPILMPGLWDCHVHFFGESQPSLEHIAVLPPSLAGLRSARDVMATLNAGFTSVREVGGYGIDFSKAIDEGWIPGPKIYSAGAPLSQTAGHGDLHTQNLEFLHDQINHGLPLGLADGVDEAIKAVRKQIRRGAKLIKICSTGGVMSRVDSPRAAQFTTPELKAMVEEATRTNMIVASHAHGTDGILAALHAGVKTIEHGSFFTKEAIDLMLEKDVMLVATRFIQQNGMDHPENMPPESYKKLVAVVGANKKSYEMAIKAGVKCALGTDLGMSSVASKFNHGMNGREFGYAVEAGMSILEAIEAGTANAPDTLGPQAPLSGQLKEGFDADFIALSENPLHNIDVLAQPEKVTHVWKGGQLFKSPSKAVSVF